MTAIQDLTGTAMATRPRDYESRYQYSPLSDGCIRLLRLLPNRDERAPVQCRLFDYPLLDSCWEGRKGTHMYEALSYVWGSAEKPQHVATDDGHIPVTTNLHMALRRLRDRVLDRIIWIDAICIDQGNTQERGGQDLLLCQHCRRLA